MLPRKRETWFIIPDTLENLQSWWFALKSLELHPVTMRARLLLLTACAFLVPTMVFSQPQSRGRINGTTLTSGNQAFENVDVSLYKGDTKNPIWETATDEHGSFSFNNLLPGTYSIKVDPKTYRSKTVGPIQVADEPSTPIVIRFAPEDRLLIDKGCPTCAVFIPPDIPTTTTELVDPVWNFWAESAGHTTSGQGGLPIAYKSIYPKTGSNAQLVVDLSAVPYDGFDKATYSRKSETAFSKRLAALAGDSTELDIIVNPDPLYFAVPSHQDVLRSIPVDLKKLRASQTQGVSLFASPRYMMRLLGEASADYSYGITAFPIRVLAKHGWAPVNIEVWSHDTNTPLTEATAFVCIVDKDGDDCGPKPAVSATAGTLTGVDLAGRGHAPDVAVQVSERSGQLVGLFKCNAAFCSDHEYHTWEVGQASAWLIAKLTTTLNLLASQEAYAQSHPKEIAPIETEYNTAGRAIFDDLFYSEQHDPGLLPVISEMRNLVSEGTRRLSGTTGPPTMFARIVPSLPQLVVVPWSLMVVPPVTLQSKIGPLGAVVEVETPLPLQSYMTPSSCISEWSLLVPPPRTSNPDDALSAVFTARDKFEPWIKRYDSSCPSCVNNDPSTFGNWLNGNVPASGSTGVVVLSHHSTDGNTDAFFMDVDTDGNIGPAAYSNVSRTFADPSFAILDACGTGKPGSSEFVHQLNRGGIFSVVSTAIDVNPSMAGQFLDLFMTHLSDASAENDRSIGRAQWLAVRDLSKNFGSRAFVFSISGNSAIKACVPPATHTASTLSNSLLGNP
jgi:hypothetical protein